MASQGPKTQAIHRKHAQVQNPSERLNVLRNGKLLSSGRERHKLDTVWHKVERERDEPWTDDRP